MLKFSVLSKWMNAIADAYNRGEADWAYPNGVSLTVQVYNRTDPKFADEAVVELAMSHGI